MTNIYELRINIKIFVILGKYFAETHIIIQPAYGDQWLGRIQFYDWFNLFKNSRMLVDDGSRLGRSSTSTDDEHVKKLMKSCVLIEVLTVKVYRDLDFRLRFRFRF